VRAVVRCALALVVVVLIGCALFAPRTVSTSRIGRASELLADAVADVPAPHHARVDPKASAVDLYGNEVDDAIATYSIDPAGSPYEVHSPQTELPRLGSPKS
jgi:hypothetical protein